MYIHHDIIRRHTTTVLAILSIKFLVIVKALQNIPAQLVQMDVVMGHARHLRKMKLLFIETVIST